MKFSERLKELMLQHDYTQQQVANAIGYSQRAVSKWLAAQSEPTASAICLLADFFDVSTDFLLGFSDTI